MRIWRELKFWAGISGKLKELKEIEKKFDVESFYTKLYEAQKRSFKEFYANAETIEDKIAVLSRYILPLNREVNLINLRLTKIQLQTKQRHPLKTPLVLALLACFFPLYVTTLNIAWLVLIDCTLVGYLLYTFFEMLETRKELWQALSKLEETLTQLEKVKD